MSEIRLEYNSDEEEISPPHNFQELKSLFCQAFSINLSKNYKFTYLYNDDECNLDENNFSEKIKIIQDEEITIHVEDDNSEESNVKKSVSFSKYKMNESKKQNDDSESKNMIVLNKLEKIDEQEKEEKLDDDKINNIEKGVNDYSSIILSKNAKNGNGNVKDNKKIVLLNNDSSSGLAESEININDKSESKEKDKEIEELNKKIKELQDKATKQNIENNELIKALNRRREEFKKGIIK